MKKLYLITLLNVLLLSATIDLGYGQSKANIKFEEELTLPEVQAKAKVEHKYIFIDAYATWCGPCKQMETTTFVDDTVGRITNEKFVSVRLQFDTTKMDNERVKSWHNISHLFEKDYAIRAFPTYLFFDPDGNIVHKDIGYKDKSAFLKLLSDASDPERQYFPIVRRFHQGKVAREEYPKLTKMVVQQNNNELACDIERYFIDKFVNTLERPDQLTKEDWTYIATYTSKILNTNDKPFIWSIKYKKLLDDVSRPGIADEIANDVIYRTEVVDPIERDRAAGRTPQWPKLENSIDRKYGHEYLKDKLLVGKANYYKNAKDIVSYIANRALLVEYNDINKTPESFWGAFYLNNSAWEVFQKSDALQNKKEIEMAIRWMDKVATIDSTIKEKSSVIANHSDTKANLLYKAGKKKLAIALEERLIRDYKAAIPNLPKAEQQYAENTLTPFYENLDRMRKGLPTWSVKKIIP